jgi:hypothetical protein
VVSSRPTALNCKEKCKPPSVSTCAHHILCSPLHADREAGIRICCTLIVVNVRIYLSLLTSFLHSFRGGAGLARTWKRCESGFHEGHIGRYHTISCVARCVTRREEPGGGALGCTLGLRSNDYEMNHDDRMFVSERARLVRVERCIALVQELEACGAHGVGYLPASGAAHDQKDMQLSRGG